MIRNAFRLCVAFLLIASCQSENPNAQTLGFDLIQSALPGVEVPSESLSFDPTKGDTLQFALGAELRVPANAFVNADGQRVEEEVKIRFRQFLDPIDMALAGINMGYDSAGSNYSLESAGMCEIRAFQQGKELFLKEGQAMELDLPTSDSSANYTIFYYDSISRKWNLTEQSMEIFDEVERLVDEDVAIALTKSLASFSLPEPELLDESALQIAVSIPEEMDAPELRIFKNTQFELLPGDTVYREDHFRKVWSWAEVKATSKRGLYQLIFTRGSEKVQYVVRPVYEGKDYEEALKLYEKERLKYKAEKRVELDLARKEMARARNEQLLTSQKERIARAKQSFKSEAERRSFESQARLALQNRQRSDAVNRNRLVRRLSITQTGLCNVDRILNGEGVNFYPLAVRDNGEQIAAPLEFVIQDRNTRITGAPGRIMSLPTNAKVSVFTVELDEFFYLQNLDVNKVEEKNGGELRLELKKLEGGLPQSYAEVRELLDI